MREVVFSKVPWITSGILLILLLLAGYWGIDAREDLAIARAANATKDAMIVELQQQIDDHTTITVEQIGQRNKAKVNVQTVVQENAKEEAKDESPRPVLSDSQLDRLRKLRDASNHEAAGARELP